MKKIQLLPVFLMMFIIPYQGFSTIRHVPAAYSTIQAGINASVNGDTVLVDPGTYYEHLNLNGRNIKLCSKYLTTGDTAYITSTKIDGSNTGRVMTINQGENSSCQIVGFTVQHGNATLEPIVSWAGGGIMIYEVSAQIKYCNIINNINNGILIGGFSSATKIFNCQVKNNISDGNGGIHIHDCGPDVEVINCIISGNTNTSNAGGGGVSIYHRGKLVNCLIINNSVPNSSSGAGGVWCDWGTYFGSQGIFITGCTIAKNTATWGGTNCIINGGEFRNCIIWGNTDNNGNSSNYNGSSYVYTCTTPLPSGTGNISSNPNFISQAANNFRLAAGSPCINTGNNSYNTQTVDLDGNPRINGTAIDMGCYEASSAPLQFSVVSHIPAKNANNINPSSNVSITFSESLDQSTLTNANIRIFGSQSGLHPAVITYNDATKTITLNPNSDFRQGEIVEVVVTKEVKSSGGSSLLNPYIWNFSIDVAQAADIYTLSQTIPSPGNAIGALFSDLDNDGDLDAIVTHHDAANADIYRNDGAGVFTLVTTLSGNGLSWATYPPVCGDFDNDGDMDIAIPSRFQNKVCIWRNNGGLAFSAWQQISVHTEPMLISIGDLNGDGYLDLIVNCNNISTFYYDVLMNDKSGNFSVTQAVLVPKRQNWQCMGDFDGDGDIDFIGGAQTESTLYFMKNNGSGIFSFSSFPLNSWCAYSGDFDNDGDLDLIVSANIYNYLQVLFNDGTGSFTSGPLFGAQATYMHKVVKDFNSDGFLDFSVYRQLGGIDIYLNNGSGTFTLDNSISPIMNNAMVYDAGDIDSDGDMDLIIPNGNDNYVSLYKASQSQPFLITSHLPAKNANSINPSANVTITFSESLDQSTLTNANIRIFGSQSGLHPAVITYNDATKTVTLNPNSDFRQGEIVEVVVTKEVKSSGGSSLLNPYIWNFSIDVALAADIYTLSQTMPSPGNAIGSIFSDLDNDGDLDAIVTHHDAADADIYRNDGAGVFTKVTTISGNGLAWATYTPVSGDFDNDGDMDIAIPSRYTSKVCIWRNNGGLAFSAWQQISVDSQAQFITLGDLNGDGYIDMVVETNSTSNSYGYDVLLNDKSGNFSVSQRIVLPSRPGEQCLGDFDGDGDIDIIGDGENGGTSYLYVMKNDGNGAFTLTNFPLSNNLPNCGDFDGDGDLDLISHAAAGYLRVLFNDGTGTFTPGPGFGSPQSYFVNKIVKDFNSDGFLDFAVDNYHLGIDIYLNNGSGIFTLDNTIAPIMGDARIFDAGDIDNDGDLDMIIPNGTDNYVSIFKGGQSQFSIVSHIPAKNANNINPSANVTITFSESLDQSTLTNANIRIFGSQSGLHPAVITYDDATKTVTLNPNNDFRLGEVMEVVVTKQVKSLSGSSLLQPYAWRFFVKVTASSDEFTLSQSIPSPGNALGSIFSDLDNDGDLDVIVTHHDAANADIYSNGGTGNFTKVTTLNGNGLSWATYPPVSGDFDNDGDMDIAIPSRFEDKVCIWRNNGGFSFSAWHQISVHTEPMQISLSDLNGDGYLDMVVNCNNASTYYYDILMNDKSGNFSVSQGVGVPKRQAWQCLGDFDGDGDVDFIGGAQNETTLYFMKNNGSGSFTVSSFPLNSACASSGDFDNDGDLDLIVSTPDIKYLQVLFNNGTGSFTAGPVFGPQREYWTRVINDFNNDGFMDFSVICRYQSMDIYINNGSGTFTLDNSFSPAMGDAFYFDAGDIDNDGDQDMIIPGSNSNVVLVYKAGQLCQTVFTGTGNWSDAARWSNGIPTSSCNATIDGTCAVTSSSVCNHLVVKEDRQLTIVSPGITCSEIVLKNGASILGNDKLTLSNPANSKVERYIHGNWDESQTTLTPSTEIHFVSTPVTGAKYNTFEKDALYSWHEQPGSADNWPSHGFPPDTDPMQSWHHYIWPCDDNAPEVLDLTNGRGYEVAVNYKWYQNSPDYPCPPLPNGYCECPQDPVFMRYFKGTLNSGDFPVAITYTTGSGNPSYTGWNLVGNPYPSAVDWSLVPKTNVYPNSAAIWNPASGGYVNVVGSGATIPSTQSLFVQASGSGAGVTFNEASRIHNNIPFYKNTITELLAIHISNAVNPFTDETYVHFDPVSQEGLDELDGRKLDNLPDAPMVWSVLPGDERLCFNTLPSGSTATIDLYFKGGIEADFTLTASGLNSFDPGNTFYLEDLGLEKDTVQNLKSNPSYAFHSRPSDEPARFLLHYGATGLQETGNEPVLIYSYDNYINVSVPSGIKGSINVYTLLGQHIAERSIQPGTINKINMENYQGYALVQVISSNRMISKKVFIR